MNNTVSISVIVPVYNAENFILSTLKNLKNQKIDQSIEFIFIDDGSTDKSLEIIKSFDLDNLKVLELSENFGPSKARNLGIKNAKGDYIYFMDADDSIEKDTLSLLFNKSKSKNPDIIFSDKKRIEKNINQRKNIYAFDEDKYFDHKQIDNEMLKRLKNPLYLTGLLDLTGRLIKRSLIVKNNIFFQEELRYMEDETFMWDLLSYVSSAFYIKKQLYNYNINPNLNTGLSESLLRGFPLSNFLIIKKSIENSLKKRNSFNHNFVELADQAYIFFVISSLISFYRSIMLGKLNKQDAKIQFLKYIKEINSSEEISKSIKNYSTSNNESPFIPLCIRFKLNFLLSVSVKLRVISILKQRKKSSK